MRAQNGGADAVGVMAVCVPVERKKGALPVTPRGGVFGIGGVEALGEAGLDAIGRLRRGAAEAQGEDDAGGAEWPQIQLPGQRHIAALSAIVAIREREMAADI